MEITQILLGERIIPLVIRRHNRARRISLRLSASRDGVVMTLPRRSSVESGMKFFRNQAKWVLANVESDVPVSFTDGTVLPILGQDIILRHKVGRGLAELKDGQLFIHGQPEFMSRRIKDFLKKYLQAECIKQVRPMAATLGKSVREVRIRDTRSRWGSCTSGGSLTFNWRLVFAPLPVLTYLIAHEVAHLQEMNHSKRFWEVVMQLCPDMQKARKWLKNEGHKLHWYDNKGG